MKHLIIVIATLAALMLPAAAQSNTRSFYDRNGAFAGSSSTHGSSTSFSDRNGRFSGGAIRHGNTTSAFDQHGRFIGSSIITSPRR